MDRAFLESYNNELRFLREMSVEFARKYPQVARRLNVVTDVVECEDPYVERLLEGFAFLTARVQRKLDAEFPRFTQHLLECVYPHYLAPTPSMTVVRMEPDLSGGVSEGGYEVPRHTELRGPSAVKGRVNCEFRTGHAVSLWPVQITEAVYLSRGDAGRFAAEGSTGYKAGIRLRLETVTEIPIDTLALDNLPIYLHGGGSLPFQLYELLLAHSLDVVVRPADSEASAGYSLGRQGVAAMGFEIDEALLPPTARGFDGYRILQEYFTLPQRFLFVKLQGLKAVLQRCAGTAVDIVILLDQSRDALEDVVSRDNFQLFCTPAINLFGKRSDRVFITSKANEFHLVVDRTRPRDYEIHSISSLTGYGSGPDTQRQFEPFYTTREGFDGAADRAYYSIQRRPTVLAGDKTVSDADYLGSEIFLSLVDSREAPYAHDLKQLGAETLCTNRELPQLIPIGQGSTDFTLTIGAPVNSVRCLAAPTNPRPSVPEGEASWRMVNHLSLNYLSLVDESEAGGARALQELLRLYIHFSQASAQRQIDGLRSVAARQVVRQVPIAGPIAFARGMEVTLDFEESAFEGVGAFLLGAVLERFFGKYVSINSFVQTVVNTRERGEIMRWPVRNGTRASM